MTESRLDPHIEQPQGRLGLDSAYGELVAEDSARKPPPTREIRLRMHRCTGHSRKLAQINFEHFFPTIFRNDPAGTDTARVREHIPDIVDPNSDATRREIALYVTRIVRQCLPLRHAAGYMRAVRPLM